MPGTLLSEVDRALYRAMVKEVILFLKGRTPELIKRVRRQMLKASAHRILKRRRCSGIG
jgi:excinuclease UvrABC nuclease subunit